MITIGNRPLSPQEPWIEKLNPIEMSILRDLMQSPYMYTYENQQQLRFEVKLRDRIVKAAYDLNYSGVQYAVFENSYCNPIFWNLTPGGGFSLKPGVKSSSAIRDIYLNGPYYAFECATAMVIVLYKAVLDALGDAVFDRLFDRLLLWAWEYDEDLGLSTVRRADYLAGDIMYFRNPAVHPATPEWQGENVVLMADGSYFGHGMGITSAQQIIANLNRQRRPFAFRSAFLLDQGTRPNYLYLSQFASTNVNRIGTAFIGSGSYRWTFAS